MCSLRRSRNHGEVYLARSSFPADRAKQRLTLRSLCLCGENRFGFTLLEILIAMFIFAVVLSTIYSSYTGTHRIRNETEAQADIYGMARVALERMQEDLESVYYVPPKGGQALQTDDEGAFVGEDKEIEGRSTDSLRFVSTAHLVFSEQEQASGTADIAYYVEEGAEGQGFLLYRSDRPTLIAESEEGTGAYVLCDSLVSMNLAYYDAEGEVYDNWDSTSDQFKDKVLKRVSIELEFQNSADPERPFLFMTSVALPLAQG